MWVTPHGPLSALYARSFPIILHIRGAYGRKSSDPLDLRAVPGLVVPALGGREARYRARQGAVSRRDRARAARRRAQPPAGPALAPGRMQLAVDAKLKGNLLPEDRKDAKEYPTKSGCGRPRWWLRD